MIVLQNQIFIISIGDRCKGTQLEGQIIINNSSNQNTDLFLFNAKNNQSYYNILRYMKQSLFLFAIILYSAHCFSISNQLTETGASITKEMLQEITDTCYIAYSFFREDTISNAKYISNALPFRGLQRNWDVIISSYYSQYIPGYIGHSTNETWWVNLKSGQILNNKFFYFLYKNSPKGGKYMNFTQPFKNAAGVGIDNGTASFIINTFYVAYDQSFGKGNNFAVLVANQIQKRVEQYCGGRWAAFYQKENAETPFTAGYVSVFEDAWLTWGYQSNGRNAFLVYKQSN